jgi:anthranilate synthase component 2
MIDNYDSFTYNLVQLFSMFKVDIHVFRNDSITLEAIAQHDFKWICISPGPKGPREAGISKAVIAHFYTKVPILGVCLGMQALNEVFGGGTCQAPIPAHGKRDNVHHTKQGIFQGISSPFQAARYHSLCCHPVAPSLKVLATSADGVIMALQHPDYPLFGVQFHPESFLSQYGEKIIHNFLNL